MEIGVSRGAVATETPRPPPGQDSAKALLRPLSRAGAMALRLVPTPAELGCGWRAPRGGFADHTWHLDGMEGVRPVRSCDPPEHAPALALQAHCPFPPANQLSAECPAWISSLSLLPVAGGLWEQNSSQLSARSLLGDKREISPAFPVCP